MRNVHTVIGGAVTWCVTYLNCGFAKRVDSTRHDGHSRRRPRLRGKRRRPEWTVHCAGALDGTRFFTPASSFEECLQLVVHMVVWLSGPKRTSIALRIDLEQRVRICGPREIALGWIVPERRQTEQNPQSRRRHSPTLCPDLPRRQSDHKLCLKMKAAPA